jgi:4,5:9,10-diseco-3-hydroxy-5,9,17-trioxoandrosta-1(10),2-diene-4-oate hydrolase
MAPDYPGRMPAAAALPTDPGPYGPTGRSAWMDVDWREHRRFVEIDGRRVNVVEIGSGEPAIVFVHGLAGSWQNWLENMPHFAAAGHRVVAFDLPGFGASEMPGEKISMPGYGRLVGALLDRLGVGPAVLVGNSMGGFIAAEVAIQFPARAERLVLVSAAGLTIEYQRNEPILGALRFGQRFLMAWGGFLAARSDAVARRPRSRELLLRLVVAHPDRLPPPLIAEQVRGARNPGFVDALDALTDYPIRARLGAIGCPTLIVWGAEDRLVPVRDAAEFERLIPGARKVVWADTGHTAMLERPQAFNRLLEAFVDEEPDAAVESGRRRGRERAARS